MSYSIFYIYTIKSHKRGNNGFSDISFSPLLCYNKSRGKAVWLSVLSRTNVYLVLGRLLDKRFFFLPLDHFLCYNLIKDDKQADWLACLKD